VNFVNYYEGTACKFCRFHKRGLPPSPLYNLQNLYAVPPYTSSTGRSKDPPKPAPAAVHPEHSLGLADAGVLDTGSSTLQEMTREIYLEVDPLTLNQRPGILGQALPPLEVGQ